MIHIVGSCDPSAWEKFIGFFPDESVIVFDDVWYTDTRPLYLVLLEPDIICPYNTDETIRTIDKYVHVYTFNEKLLTMFPEKTTRYLGNYATVQPFEDKKIFKISGWASTKIFNNAPGHHLRLEIYNRQLELSHCTFFRSINRNIGTCLPEVIEGKNPFLGEDFMGGGKKCLFEGFQFSIVLENSQQKNYFTEKIIDCLITKTIPIYWGCPNISEFFDTTGWLFFHNFDSLLEIINNLDETYYEKFLDVIDKNFYNAFGKKDFFNNILVRD